MKDDAIDQQPRPCWGFLLTGNAGCTPGFRSSTGKFKNHFCAQCSKHGLRVNPAHARIVPPEAVASHLNPSTHGLWANTEDNIAYRVVNQTSKCNGAPIILTRAAASAAALGFPPVAENLLHGGELLLGLSKGTLVPLEPQRVSRDNQTLAAEGGTASRPKRSRELLDDGGLAARRLGPGGRSPLGHASPPRSRNE